MIVGLVGVLPIALGVIIFSDNGQTNPNTTLKDAEAKVAKNPKDITSLVSLSAQYRAAGRPKDALDTLQKAIDLGPKTTNELRIVVGALGSDSAKQLTVLRTFTKAYPKNPDGWYQYGLIAANTGDTLGARLAYQKVLAIVPASSPLTAQANAGLEALAQSAPTNITPTTPSSP